MDDHNSEIKLAEVKPVQKELLWNINQKYLYEMTNYYHDEMDEKGNYSYGYFDAYFSEPLRHALFIYADHHIVGFALLNPYSYINQKPDMVIAEFCIFPAYRRNHYAEKSAIQIISTYGKLWEIKYNERNIAAKKLWEKVTSPFHPRKYKVSDEETVLSFMI